MPCPGCWPHARSTTPMVAIAWSARASWRSSRATRSVRSPTACPIESSSRRSSPGAASPPPRSISTDCGAADQRTPTGGRGCPPAWVPLPPFGHCASPPGSCLTSPNTGNRVRGAFDPVGSPHTAGEHPVPEEERAVKTTVSMTINGVKYSHEVEPRLLLVHYVRELAGLTGTHVGCDTSQCGACTVHVNGLAVKSCTLLAVQCEGAQLKTIEGMAENGKLHPIQDAFWEKHGLQCGFCTPGMIMSAAQLLERNPRPSDPDIRHWLEGNLCRCTGYHNIVKAIEWAAEKMAAR